MRLNRLGIGTALFAACLLVAGCNETAEDISRVQTNLVDKEIFQGDWWFSRTVIDAKYDNADILQGLAFSGAMSAPDYGVDSSGYSLTMARIRWVIDQNYLYAYRAYELIDGGNDDGRAEAFRGQPLAAYRITSHVDVRREYSSVTGEETNVIVENTSDNRWWDRRFVRVDWSMNLLTDFYGDMSLSGFARMEAVPFFFQEGAHGEQFPESWQPTFVRVKDDPTYRFKGEWPSSEDNTVHYMSFVNQEVWSPGANCLYYGTPCASAAMTVRNAFLRVPPNHEYAVETETHKEFDRFGLFRMLQRTYVRGGKDRETTHTRCVEDADCGGGGTCDTARHVCVGGLSGDYGETDFLTFYRPRHNFYSDSLTDQQCLADWECSGRYEDTPGTPGSVCDRGARRCTIPIADRPTRRVTYHLNAGFPAYLSRVSFEIMGGWNEIVMRGQRASTGRAAPTADRIACQNEEPTRYCYCGENVRAAEVDSNDTCAWKYDPFQSPADAAAAGVVDPYDCYIEGPADVAMPETFEDYATPASYNYNFVGSECLLVLKANTCDAQPGQPCEELGDIRYQFFNYIDHGQVFFGGVSIPLSEPTTGELVTSNANFGAESVESIGTVASQYFPVLRGEVSEEERFAGEHIRGYYSRLGQVERPVTLASSGADEYTSENPSRPSSRLSAIERSRKIFEDFAPRAERLRGMEGRAQIFSDRMRSLANTPIESRLLGSLGQDGLDAMMIGVGAERLPANARVTDQAIADRVSPFRNQMLSSINEERRRQQMFGKLNVDPKPTMGELYNARYWQYWADAFEGRSNANASIRMRQQYTRGVMFHEMGHSMGLRHNFAASFDRDNYFDGYFNVARELPLPNYDTYDTTGPDGTGGPDGEVTGEEANRYVRDLRDIRNRRSARGAGNVMASSVMDYHGDLSDFSGIGRYDAAAVIFSHFNEVEAFNGDPRSRGTGGTLDGLLQSDTFSRSFMTYYRGGESCDVTEECPFASGRPEVDGQIVTQRCVDNPRDVRDGRNPPPCSGGRNCVCSNFDDDFRAYTGANPPYEIDVDGDGERDHWPVRYLFCGDERTDDISYCNRFDAGESFRESVDHFRRAWEESYPGGYFRNYRRGGGYGGTSLGSIYDAVKIFQHLYFRFFNEPGFQSQSGPLGFEDQFIASIDVMNWFAEVASLPDVGSYKLDTRTNTYQHVSETPDAPGSDFSLLPGQGYYMWSAYQTGQNGFFRQERAGTFYDKFFAMYALANRVWGLNFTADERYYINFFDLFPIEITEIFGGYVQDDPRAFAPRITFGSDGKPVVNYMDFYRSGTCGTVGNYEPCRGSQESVYRGPAIGGTSTEVLRDWATVLALAQFPVFYDTTFEQRLSIFKQGNGDGFRLPTVKADGVTPTCGYGDTGCTDPDYIVYNSSRLNTAYVAVVVRPRIEYNLPEEQLGYQLLRRLSVQQARVAELKALVDGGTATPEQRTEYDTLRVEQQSDESFLDYLIEIQRNYGISSYL